jgi:hypothetical protein
MGESDFDLELRTATLDDAGLSVIGFPLKRGVPWTFFTGTSATRWSNPVIELHRELST